MRHPFRRPHWSDGGTWGGAEDLGGVATTDPSATSWGNHRIDIVVGNQQGGISHIAYDKRWFGWDGIGGVDSGVSRRAAIVSDGPGKLHVLWFSGNGHATGLRHSSYFAGAWHLSSTLDVSSRAAYRNRQIESLMAIYVPGDISMSVVMTWEGVARFGEERWTWTS